MEGHHSKSSQERNEWKEYFSEQQTNLSDKHIVSRYSTGLWAQAAEAEVGLTLLHGN